MRNSPPPTFALPSAHADTLAVLIVEDTVDDYDLVVARLARSFPSLYTIRVDTLAEVEAQLPRRPWSAVISDHRLPGFTSWEVLEIVRGYAPDLPFVIMSGAIGEEYAVEAMQAGADDYVMKDNLVRLAPALSRALERARLRRQRRDAERALVESEARFRALATNLPGMVFQIERSPTDLDFVYASDGAVRLFGVEPAELGALPGRWVDRLQPDDREVLLSRLTPASAESETAGGRWIDVVVHTLPHDDQGVRIVRVAARARRLAGERTVWDGIAVDITQQRRAEDALRVSQRELRELGTHLERAREEERAAIAREIHDEIGSSLTGLRFQLAWLKTQIREPALADALKQTDRIVDGAIAASNRIMQGLRPPILDQGIVAALEWLARTFEQNTGVRCTFTASPEEIELPPAAAIVVFRICQEALNNVAKHAAARRAVIDLVATERGLELEVSDDGRGIDWMIDAPKPGHFGLKGMHERANALGGRVTVSPGERGGTVVSLHMPMPELDIREETPS
jgi:two-component system, NarL family, sensor histidine kinase UhpB